MIDLVETLKSNSITMRNYLLGKFNSKITLQMLQLQFNAHANNPQHCLLNLLCIYVGIQELITASWNVNPSFQKKNRIFYKVQSLLFTKVRYNTIIY